MKTLRAGNHSRETLRMLCARATELLEDMHEPVARGRAMNASARRYRAIARGLRTTLQELSSIADGIDSILEFGPLPDAARRNLCVRSGRPLKC
jgi:hypothetical protein